MTRLVDFHCHLDLYRDFPAAVREAESAGVFTLTVTTTPRAWPRNRELTRSCKFVVCALGLHPQLVAEKADELPIWERYLSEASFIGEVGLDAGPRFYHSFEAQKRIFSRVLSCCAEVGKKVLTVHSVRAPKLVLDAIERDLPSERGRVVLHWFTGDASQARRAAAMGCYFSINAEMLKTANGRKLVKELPRNRLLTETDGPFTRVDDDKPMRPADVKRTLDDLAAVLETSPAALSDMITQNLDSLLAFTK